MLDEESIANDQIDPMRIIAILREENALALEMAIRRARIEMLEERLDSMSARRSVPPTRRTGGAK